MDQIKTCIIGDPVADDWETMAAGIFQFVKTTLPAARLTVTGTGLHVTAGRDIDLVVVAYEPGYGQETTAWQMTKALAWARHNADKVLVLWTPFSGAICQEQAGHDLPKNVLIRRDEQFTQFKEWWHALQDVES